MVRYLESTSAGLLLQSATSGFLQPNSGITHVSGRLRCKPDIRPKPAKRPSKSGDAASMSADTAAMSSTSALTSKSGKATPRSRNNISSATEHTMGDKGYCWRIPARTTNPVCSDQPTTSLQLLCRYLFSTNCSNHGGSPAARNVFFKILRATLGEAAWKSKKPCRNPSTNKAVDIRLSSTSAMLASMDLPGTQPR